MITKKISSLTKLHNTLIKLEIDGGGLYCIYYSHLLLNSQIYKSLSYVFILMMNMINILKIYMTCYLPFHNYKF